MSVGGDRDDAAVQIEAADSVRAALAAMTRAFRAAGLAAPEIDARFLLQGILARDGAQLLADPERRIGGAAPRLAAAARRRLDHEPVSRILGVREFYGRPFVITPDVLDPRPDTETVVELALKIIGDKGWREKPIAIADIGVGSGAIALTMLAELPMARAVATDVSAAALLVAERNAFALGLAGRFSTLLTRGLENAAGPFDVILSNPPYIPAAKIAGLAAEVRRYDPLQALDGGPDGLDIYRQIASDVRDLKSSCVIIVEVGARQAEDVIEIFSAVGGVETGRALDLGGHVRAVALEIHC